MKSLSTGVKVMSINKANEEEEKNNNPSNIITILHCIRKRFVDVNTKLLTQNIYNLTLISGS